MPDSRPRPPLLAWDGIVIANADFAAMVAAAVNATSAERREADSLSAAATVALRRARRARTGAACSTHTHETVSINPSRARQLPHTRPPSSHPSSSTFHRASFVPIHPPIQPSIHPTIDRRLPSAHPSRVRSSRAYSRTYRAKGSGVRGRREHHLRRRRRVSRARARALHHSSNLAPRSRISNLEVSFHGSRLVDESPHTRDHPIDRSRSRDDDEVGGSRGFRCSLCVCVVDGRCAYDCTDVSYEWMIGRTLSYVVQSVGRPSFVLVSRTTKRGSGEGSGVEFRASRVHGWHGWMDE